MRAIVAYAPSLALLAIGLLALALIPPTEVPVACTCPAQTPGHPVPCGCASGVSVNLVGEFLLLVTWTSALVYALVVRYVRRRAARIGAE